MFEASFLFNLPCLVGATSVDISWLIEKVSLATWETIYMVAISTALAYVMGLPLGVILVITDKGHILENAMVNQILGFIVNVFRSIPFIIFLILVIPLTKLLVGGFIGTVASMVPLTLAAVPFVARLVETSLKEIEWGLIEAALSMGANTWQIITKVLLPETSPSLILGVAITTINLVSYSAMAGIVGGGGLGTLAYYYGYQRYQTLVLLVTVVILVVMVQGVQLLGDTLAARVIKQRR
ncbi:MAG TPA: methionine ABC transporter permease [Syntrophomonadaceae bacterium]|nr:methionine ABC transporter permease [Syntrophomonadaceae bacterium]